MEQAKGLNLTADWAGGVTVKKLPLFMAHQCLCPRHNMEKVATHFSEGEELVLAP